MTLETQSAFLELNAIWKSYGGRGSEPVLKGVSGALARGRIAALLGPNGAGKTTLMRICAKLQFADSGEVTRRGRILYYGGFDTLPTAGTINRLRRALGLPNVANGSREIATLSRGELQAVGLDVAFELGSDVLLLDEPWTSLEPDSRETLNARIRRESAERAILCSSHDLDEVARVADDILFLNDGIGTWKHRGESEDSFRRDDLIREYRQRKQT